MMRLVTLAEYIVLAVVAPESLRKIAGEWYVTVPDIGGMNAN